MPPKKAVATRQSARQIKAAAAGKAEKKTPAANTSAPRTQMNGIAEPAVAAASKARNGAASKSSKSTTAAAKGKSTTVTSKTTVTKRPTADKNTNGGRKTAKDTVNGTSRTTKTATTKAPASTNKTTTKKRKAADDADDAAASETSNKRVKTKETPKQPAPKKGGGRTKAVPKGAPLNRLPTQKLHVLVCGDGTAGELGLGAAKNAINVKRPRLNSHLAADTVGVVQVAAGGMHVLALTHDNKIYSWGVNDQGALGRDTTWGGGLRDVDADEASSESSNEGENLNPKEATPTAIPSEYFPDGTIFCKVAAGDSSSWALTTDGQVYGWGTFRSNEGIIGFRKDVFVQERPMRIPELKNITDLACGANHVLALTSKHKVVAWGNGQQNQLGRRVVERSKIEGLVPRELGIARTGAGRTIAAVGAGAYHSFAVDTAANVYAWGLNSFGECGVPVDPEDDTGVVPTPTRVEALLGHGVAQVNGGSHHSAAVTRDGQLLVWGRMDGHQLGIPAADIPDEDTVKDSRDQPRILAVPRAVPAFDHDAALVACGSDHTIGLTTAGKAYTWGFNATYQAGQGTDEDVDEATLIDNTATRDKKVVWAGAGGQFSVFAAEAEDVDMVNGV